MSTSRFQALAELNTRQPLVVPPPSVKVSDYFGSNVFSPFRMREYLTDEVYDKLMDCINHGTRIDRSLADHISSAMKEWAMSKGATHYTHWFQPLTGATVEKHDSF